MKQFEGYRRGINLGGWFSQCDNSIDTYNNFIKKEDFKRISRWGLDHVRIPVDYNLFQNRDCSFKESGFDRIDNCIKWCKEYGLNMILDLHKTIGFSFDDNEAEDGFFEKEEYQENFYNVWQQFAKRFGNYDNVAFGLLNEITRYDYKDIWNQVSTETIKIIRQYAPGVKILIGGYYNNDISAIKDLLEPYDENIVYEFHCYSPLIFTHQGAYWINGMDTDFTMNLDESIENYQKYSSEYIKNGYIADFDGINVIDEQYFEKFFKEAINIAEERNVPLYCGEYGVIDRADPFESLKWLKLINSVFEKYQIGRALWNYKEKDFGLVDAHYDEVRDEYLKFM